jgi:signal transduction histidine kinase
MCSQILWNILGNDLKYAAPHGKVSVAFSADDRYVSVRFADAGPGMKPREMKKAFDRYYRAGSAAECGKGGFGIGLCTAREFAEAMGGKLTLEANSPRGCIFTLTLPRA